MTIKSYGTFAATVFLAGCASLDVENVTQAGSQSGLKYELPMTQFKIDIARRAISCTPNGRTGPDVNKYVEGGQLILANEAIVEVIQSVDPAGQYVIDPRSLSNFFNKSTFSVEYHAGTRQLKTINAGVEDQVGPAIITIAKTAAGLGGVSAGTGGGPLLACKPGLAAKIKAADDAKGRVTNATADLTGQNKAIAAIKAQQTAALPSVNEALAANLSDAVFHQSSLVNTLRLAQQDYKVASAGVTIKHDTILWPKSADDFEFADNQALKVTAKQLEKQLTAKIANETFKE